MRQKNIELHIEELVLLGFEPGDRKRIAEAVESELEVLFARQGVLQLLEAGGEIDNLDGGSFNVAANSRVEVIGKQVARAVYGRLKL